MPPINSPYPEKQPKMEIMGLVRGTSLCPVFSTTTLEYLCPYIHIVVYTYIQAYHPLFYFVLDDFTFGFIYPFISVSGFDLTFRPLGSHPRLLSCKGIVGKEHGKHRTASYWRKTSRDPPESQIAVSRKLCRPILCLCSSTTHDGTMHIKGSR